MPCTDNCEASQPCYATGCPNAPPPRDAGDRPSGGPRSNRRNRQDGQEPRVRFGVGETSSEDLHVDVHVDEVIRARGGGVQLGVGNYARRDLTADVVGNRVDSAGHLEVGVGNVADRDGYLRVSGNEFRGSSSSSRQRRRRSSGSGVSIGVGNRAAGDLRMVITGNQWRQHNSADDDDDDDDDERTTTTSSGGGDHHGSGVREDERDNYWWRRRSGWFRCRDSRRSNTLGSSS